MAIHHNPDTDTTQQLTGTVESIIYRNDDSGYTVCSVRQQKKLHGTEASATLVGTCAAIWEGEEIQATGEWTRHKSHGLQFQASAITCVTPTSEEGLRRYLASGLIKGIGPTFAKRIVDKFGEKTLDVIDRESGRLCEVEGIGEHRRRIIKESWTEQRNVRDIMIFLQSHSIGTAKASRIYRQYGSDAIAVVKQNPYRLCREVWGIGFKSADAIALSVGIPHDSELRACAGLIYTLNLEAEDGGHCFMQETELLLRSQDILGISIEILTDALQNEFLQGSLIKEDNRVYLRDLYVAETIVAAKLIRLMEIPRSFKPIDADKALQWVEKHIRLKLAATQRSALLNALNSKVSIITGGPGVGKTTIIKALTEIFKVRKLNVHLAAPTGRAAKRMSEATACEAQTIHRLLKFNPNLRHFEFNAENPITGDCFILDETSMIDLRLMEQFVQALPDSATLILVGDTDQLPSVGPGNVLRDLISSNTVPYCRLNTIFRQDTSGLIVRNAHRVNNGEFFETRSGESDFYFIETGAPEKIIQRVIEMMSQRIPGKFGFDPLADVQILTPMRRNLLGTDNLNDVIQATINPGGESLVKGHTSFRKNDRVMQLRNNYDKEVFNGDIGFVKQVDTEDRILTVLFDGRPVNYQHSELDELVLAYACSIHKSQGSEYPAAIVVMHTQHYKLLQRNLLYTAITRGKQLVILIGSSRAVNIAIRSNQVRERRTTLSQRLQPQMDSTFLP